MRPASDTDADLRLFEGPEGSPPLNATAVRAPAYENTVTTDMTTGVVTHRTWVDEGTTTYDDHDGWTITSTHEQFERVHPDDPLSCELEILWTENFSRGAWEVSSRTRTLMRSTATHFIIRGELDAWMGDETVHSQVWDSEVPRDLV